MCLSGRPALQVAIRLMYLVGEGAETGSPTLVFARVSSVTYGAHCQCITNHASIDCSSKHETSNRSDSSCLPWNRRAASANCNKIFACGICSKPTLLGQQRCRNSGSLHGLRDAKLLTKRSATSYHDVRCQMCECLLGLSWLRLHTSS